jgi:hypothetical protein
MPNTFTLIQAVTVPSAQAAIEFTSIPSTYTDLVVVGSCRTARANATDETTLTFNGSTSGYSWRLLFGNGSSAGSASGSSDVAIYGIQVNGNNSTASTFGNFQIYIPNYAGSANKSVSIEAVAEDNASTAFMKMVAGLWSNTAAITSLKLSGQTGNFQTNSTAYLYGIVKS